MSGYDSMSTHRTCVCVCACTLIDCNVGKSMLCDARTPEQEGVDCARARARVFVLTATHRIKPRRYCYHSAESAQNVLRASGRGNIRMCVRCVCVCGVCLFKKLASARHTRSSKVRTQDRGHTNTNITRARDDYQTTTIYVFRRSDDK